MINNTHNYYNFLIAGLELNFKSTAKYHDISEKKAWYSEKVFLKFENDQWKYITLNIFQRIARFFGRYKTTHKAFIVNKLIEKNIIKNPNSDLRKQLSEVNNRDLRALTTLLQDVKNHANKKDIYKTLDNSEIGVIYSSNVYYLKSKHFAEGGVKRVSYVYDITHLFDCHHFETYPPRVFLEPLPEKEVNKEDQTIATSSPSSKSSPKSNINSEEQEEEVNLNCDILIKDKEQLKKIRDKAAITLTGEILLDTVFGDPDRLKTFSLTGEISVNDLEKEENDKVAHKMKRSSSLWESNEELTGPQEAFLYDEDAPKKEPIKQNNKPIHDHFTYELEMFKHLEGLDNIIKLYRVVDLGNGKKGMIQEGAGCIFTVLDDCGNKHQKFITNLSQLMQEYVQGYLPKNEEKKLYTILLEIFKGIKQIHEKNGVYNDLKSDNILFDSEGHAKLSDLGSVALSDIPSEGRTGGTLGFIAPECLKELNRKTVLVSAMEKAFNSSSEINKAADVWSCGMLLFELFYRKQVHHHPVYLKNGKSIFDDENDDQLDTVIHHFDKLNKKNYEQNYKFPKEKIEQLIWKATRVDPKERPTIDEFLKEFELAIKN